MSLKNNLWKQYFVERSKKVAAGSDIAEPLEYGREVYSSPKQIKMTAEGIRFIRWMVMEFEGEFNVFLEKSTIGSKKTSNLAASFNLKEKAIKFALEMCLICNGKLNRKKTIFD